MVLDGNRIRVDELGEFNTIGEAGRAITKGKWTPTLNKARFWYLIDATDIEPSVAQTSEGFSDDAGDPLQPSEEEIQFALEQHLEDFLHVNWSKIHFGRPLEIYQDDTGESGRQFQTKIGVIDFLCKDAATGDIVVVELKKGRSSDKVLGQCQRYMGWIQEHVAKPGQAVRGLIVAPEQDERLRYALKVAPNVDSLCYRVNFQLFDPETHDA